MKSVLFALLLGASLFVANACTCFPTTLKRSFFDTTTDKVLKGKVLFVLSPPNLDPFGKRTFLIQTETVYKGCNVPSWFIADSPVQSATCGINLSKGTSYLFVLPKGGPVKMINLCMFIRPFSSLSRKEVQFLNTRNVCCKGVCQCADGNPPVNCFRQPCSPPETPPCDEAVRCVDNYCGGCLAEWFTKDGEYACLPSLFPETTDA